MGNIADPRPYAVANKTTPIRLSFVPSSADFTRARQVGEIRSIAIPIHKNAAMPTIVVSNASLKASIRHLLHSARASLPNPCPLHECSKLFFESALCHIRTANRALGVPNSGVADDSSKVSIFNGSTRTPRKEIGHKDDEVRVR